jgi:sec-independent protein translocase protein TatA
MQKGEQDPGALRFPPPGSSGKGILYILHETLSTTREVTMFEGLFQPMHLLVILGIALLIFGPRKLPELGKGLGEAIRGFKSAIKTEEEEPAAIAVSSVADSASKE